MDKEIAAMKYQRMTKHSDLGTLHACDINGNEQPLCELTVLDTDNLIGRLCELEDKIESGELISTKEVGDTEIEFFAKHNESVRVNTAKAIFSWIYKNLVNMNFITGNVEINLSALQNFAKTYGVDIFDIFKRGGKQ